MGDEWENDDFEPVLDLNAVNISKTVGVAKGDEEEDLLQQELRASQAAAATARTSSVNAAKSNEANAAFLNKLKNAEAENETADQRRLRERRQVEEADHELTDELFQGNIDQKSSSQASTTSLPVKITTNASSISSGAASSSSSAMSKAVGSVVLNSNKDHFDFGNLVSVKLSDSTAFNTAAFYRGLSKALKQPSMTVEVLDDILGEIKKIRDTKAKETPVGEKGVPKKSKQEVKKDEKRHQDIFGFKDKVDKYSSYEDIEDDYM